MRFGILKKIELLFASAGTGPLLYNRLCGRASSLELECDVLAKGTNIDGVYNADPRTNPEAKKYDEVTFNEVLEKELRVMDATAIAQCRDNDMPIVVFELMKKGNLEKVIMGEKIGTKVY
ncbi:UNVERIFIED_CONTAM: hypothetical protein GTU68_015155 [Idotea baltica]|nr:hypothetical protein [Idotea baltica]